MKPSEVREALEEAIELQTPVMLWGPPGIGKSQIVSQIAKDNDIGLVDMRLSTYDPTDLKGIPAIRDEKAVWLNLGDLPQVERDGAEGILFLDEINAAPPATTAAAYRLVLDRKIGNYRLPDGWTIIAAGNREADKGIVYKMPAPLANRFTHLEQEVDFNDWLKWAMSNGISYQTTSFIRFMPKHLHDFDPTQRAFPTPRMWAIADKYVNSRNPVARQNLIYGSVGEGAGREFLSFIKMSSQLEDPDLIIMNPTDARVPTSLDALYATVGALSARATQSNFERILKYADRLKPEFQVILVHDSTKRNKSVADTEAFGDWANKHANILI